MGKAFRPHHSWLASFGRLPASVLALPLVVLVLATPAASQIVTGRVVDADSNEPLEGASIALVDTMGTTQRAALSNTAGEFLIALTAPGTYSILASRLGYAMIKTTPIEIGEGEAIEVEVLLDVEAVALEPLTVVVRRRETQRERDLRGYLERAEHYGEPHAGSIQIFTRASLRQWDGYSVAELLRTFILWVPNCTPKVFRDGQVQSAEFLKDLEFLSVANLEGIELYAGSGPGKGRFWDADGCGVILLWTRPLPEGGSGKFSLLEFIVVVGAAALLTLQAVWLLL